MNNQLNVIPDKESTASSFLSHKNFDLQGAFQKEKLLSQLNSLSGKRVFFRSDFSKDSIPLQSLGSDRASASYLIKEFSSSPRERLVVAVDSSCALIGETEEGSIYAGRVAIVYASKSRILKYCRAGPMIFYLDPQSIRGLLGPVVSSKIARLILYDRTLAERFIRLQLERSAQLEASKICSDSIILVDGSLKSSILESKGLSMRELERTSEDNFNQLLGISKTSSIKFISKIATSMQSGNDRKGPAFIDVTESVKVLVPSIESRILLVKFSQNSTVFRIDYSYHNGEEESHVLSDLRYNDLLFRGYPETLRLAHHLSVFEASTVSSVRSYLTSRYGIVQIPSDDLRATILGRLV